MSITRRQLIQATAVGGIYSLFPVLSLAQSNKLEQTNVTIAVGGQALIYYLPLSIALFNKYFEQEGLDVKIMNFAGGSKALQAVVGGSADVCSGAFEHTISLQKKRQFYRAFVMQSRAPLITLGVSNKNLPDFKSPNDLKGKKIGVTAPGSSTNMLLSFYLAKHDLKDSDVAVIGTGSGASAVNAIRSGQVDAMSNVDPMISMLQHSDDIRIIADTRALKDTNEIFGGPMPSSCLYASQKYIDANPNTIQSLTNAIVKANRWIHQNTADQIMRVLPENFLLGQPDVYRLALEKSFEGLSPDGLIDVDGPATALKALVSYQGGFKAESIDLAKCWTNDFVSKSA